MKHAAICLLLVLAGCSLVSPEPPRDPLISLRYEEGWTRDRMARRAATAPPDRIHAMHLGQGDWVSHSLVSIPAGLAEKPHYHRFHDITVFLTEGEGTLHLEDGDVELASRDVIHLRRGTPHWFENTGDSRVIAFIVFSPPLAKGESDFVEWDRGTPIEEAEPEAGAPWWKLF